MCGIKKIGVWVVKAYVLTALLVTIGGLYAGFFHPSFVRGTYAEMTCADL